MLLIIVVWVLFRYYKNKYFVQQDTELQAFANELSAEGTGHNGGIGMVSHSSCFLATVY